MRFTTLRIVAAAVGIAGCSADQVQRPLVPIEGPLRAVYDTASVVPYLGTQQVLVLLVNVDSAMGNRVARDAFIANTRAELDTLGRFLNANAAGRVTMAYTYKGPYDVSSSICNPTSLTRDDNNQALLRAAVAAADPTVDFLRVRQIVLAGRYPAGDVCNSGTSGQPRRVWNINTAEGLLDASVTFVTTTNPYTGKYELLHEFTHTIGATHGFYEVCTSNGARVQVNHRDAPCAISEWLGLDVMSASLKHFSAPGKIRWGWIDRTELQTVSRATITRSGTYTLYPQEGPYAPRTPRAMRVMFTSPSLWLHSFVLEFRRDTLPPAVVGNPEWGPEPPIRRGVYLYADQSVPHSTYSHLVEHFDGTQSQTAYRMRPLTVGVAFRDCTVGVTITVQSVSATSASVNVKYFTPGTVACTEGVAL